MWVFLPTGFYSVVLAPEMFQKGRVDGTRIVMVRARLRRHLQNVVDRWFGRGIMEPGEMVIGETPDRDYRYRLMMRAEAWAEIMHRETVLMTTTNFKDAAHEAASRMNAGHQYQDANDYANTLTDVWRLMNSLQQRERESVMSRRPGGAANKIKAKAAASRKRKPPKPLF